MYAFVALFSLEGSVCGMTRVSSWEALYFDISADSVEKIALMPQVG